jgi:hypothetical protein
VEAFTTRLVEGGDPFDEESAQCFAQGVVDEVGFDRLVDLGATEPGADPEDIFGEMTEDEVNIVADLGLTCIDIHAIFVAQFEGAGLPHDTAVCIADGVAGAPFLKDMIVTAMLGEPYDPMTDPEASSLIMGLITQCMAG